MAAVPPRPVGYPSASLVKRNDGHFPSRCLTSSNLVPNHVGKMAVSLRYPETRIPGFAMLVEHRGGSQIRSAVGKCQGMLESRTTCYTG